MAKIIDLKQVNLLHNEFVILKIDFSLLLMLTDVVSIFE